MMTRRPKLMTRESMENMDRVHKNFVELQEAYSCPNESLNLTKGHISWEFDVVCRKRRKRYLRQQPKKPREYSTRSNLREAPTRQTIASKPHHNFLEKRRDGQEFKTLGGKEK
jgi:hypothetical protein